MAQPRRTPIRRMHVILLALLLAALALAACRPAQNPPTPTVTLAVGPGPGRSPTAARASSATLAPTEVGILVVTATRAPAAAQTASATPNPCAPPANWVLHSVRQDETLYYLATSNKVTVEEVLKANCLASDVLQVGQKLYLPAIPPARPTFPPPPTAPPAPPTPQPTSCGSSFSCTRPDLPPLALESASPADPSFVPCDGTLGKAWIQPVRNRLKIGQRFYFLACEFQTKVVSAVVTMANGKEDAPALLFESPNPDLPTGKAGAVLTWPALPGQPTGAYKIVVQGEGAEQAEIPFFVNAPDEDAILVDPVAGPPGTTFYVYYIFNRDATVDITLNGEDKPTVLDHAFTGRDAWTVRMINPLTSERGWVMRPLDSKQNDKRSGYVITYRSMQTYDMLWIK